MNGIGASLSGLTAMSLLLSNSANNVANANSTSSLIDGETFRIPYVPKDVVLSAVEPESGGGVRASIRNREPASYSLFSPGSPNADALGLLQVPNVSLEQEAVTQVLAARSFESNLKALKAQFETQGSLFDTLS